MTMKNGVVQVEAGKLAGQLVCPRIFYRELQTVPLPLGFG